MTTIIQNSFGDFDDLAATARGWSLELAKLDRTDFDGEIYQWLGDGLILSRGRFGSRLKQTGCPPPGLRTVTVPIASDMSMVWRGRHVTGDNLLVFPREGELDAISDPRFDIFTVSFDEEAFLAQAELIGVRGLSEKLRTEEVFPCEPHRMDLLREILFRIVRDPCAADLDPVVLKTLVHGELIRLLANDTGRDPRRHHSDRRLKIVRNADRYLAARPGEAVSVQDLCRALGVGARTLQYAFQQHIGVSPKTYINSLRLNAVRKELRANGPDTTCVADVANGLGFWHMGQFAADYRRQFGENPSQTLGRCT